MPEQDLLQINIWLGAMETTTNMHYDANHNLLFVLKGSKRVALLPPNMAAGVQAMPVRECVARWRQADPLCQRNPFLVPLVTPTLFILHSMVSLYGLR